MGKKNGVISSVKQSKFSLLSLLRFSLVSFALFKAEKRISALRTAAFSFAITSPSLAASAAVRAALAASSRATAASAAYRTTCLQPKEELSFITIEPKPSKYLTSQFHIYNAYPERAVDVGLQNGFSTRKISLWTQQQRNLSALLTPEAQFQEMMPNRPPRAVNEEGKLQQEEAITNPESNKRRRDYSWGTRKSSYSRVRLVEGCGRVSINGRDAGEYLQDNPWWLHNCIAPLMELNIQRQYDVIAEVHGGGLGGQSGAIMLAVAREIVRQDPEKRQPLRRAGFLTVDSRRVERKKFGLRKARKREQYSKR